MSVKLRWKNYWIPFETVTWSGTDTQCSRQLAFTLASSPYDDNFQKISIKLGDMVYLYDGNRQLFLGTVTARERSNAIGTVSYTAMDFMHHLLRSSATYKFKKKTPESIVRKVCRDLKISTTSLARTGYSIPKLFCEEMPVYDIMIKAYQKAKAHTGKKYMPAMKGKKVTVVVKGTDSGLTLTQGQDIIEASYNDTLDNMVDRVIIYSDKGKKLGKVQNKKNVRKYGVYQEAYTKEKKVNAKKAAKILLTGVTKEASIDAVGNVKAVSGYSIKIQDKASGLTGTFYIISDSHTFSGGSHTMNLGIAWKNTMEGIQ